MMLKSSDSLFKRAVPAGSAILMAAVLSACGDGPIDNSNLASMPPGNNDHLAQKPGDTGAPNGNKYLTYQQWKAEWEKSDEGRKQAEEAARRESEADKQRQHDEQMKVVAEEALRLAHEYEREKFDLQDPLAKDPVFVIVGLDESTRWSEDDDRTGRRAKFVSLHGHNVYEYFKKNCPVTEGEDPIRPQTEGGYPGLTEMRRT